MAGWANLQDLVKREISLKRQQGADTAEVLALHEQAGSDPEALMALYHRVMALDINQELLAAEPDALEDILRLSPGAKEYPLPDEDTLRDSMYGAWLGRSAGCALGKPIEAGPYMGGSEGRSGALNVKLWFEGADAWPITGYTPESSRAEETHNLFISKACIASTREHIKYMESDDDIRYTVLGLKLLEEHGAGFTGFDVGKIWHSRLPYRWVCTAETQAYLNFAQVTHHHENETPADWDEKQQWVRTWLNPMRELIGAQIRADAYGYAAAGRPLLAARLAYQDAAFSHTRNGIYGAMFIAACIAAAFSTGDPEEIIKAGLSVVPAGSRLTQAVTEACALAREHTDMYELAEALWQKFAHYGPVHTVNNAALCAAALIFAKGDFQTAIATSVLGWDTDCNGATVGSIMGAALGAGKLPKHWIEPLNDTLYSGIMDFHPIAISACADRSFQTYQNLKNKE